MAQAQHKRARSRQDSNPTGLRGHGGGSYRQSSCRLCGHNLDRHGASSNSHVAQTHIREVGCVLRDPRRRQDDRRVLNVAL